MTQRYKITTQLAPTLNGGYDVVAIAAPDDQGDYVRHDAVSHLTEEKTLEQHKEDFLEFLRSESVPIENPDKFDQVLMGYGWNVWKAARGVTE